MSNLTHITETALLLLAAYLIGCIAGYCLHRVLHAARGRRHEVVVAPVTTASAPAEGRRPKSPAIRLAAAAGTDTPPALLPVQQAQPANSSATRPARRNRPAPNEPRPIPLSAPRSGRADNLKKIKGIGPKIEASLNDMGIFHFDQIAVWNKANIEWVDAQLAFKGRIRRERWVEQATELAKQAA